MASFLSPLLRAPEARFVLRHGRHHGLIASRIEPAFDSASRRRGLLGRTAFADGDALILAPCSSIHTCFMTFAIDVLFVSRTGEVLKARSAMGAWRLALRPGAFAVIELPAGTIDRVGMGRGDFVVLAGE